MGIFTNRDNKKKILRVLWKGAGGWKMHSLWTGSKRGGFTFFHELAEGADGSGRCSRGAKKAAVRESFVHRKGNDHHRRKPRPSR